MARFGFCGPTYQSQSPNVDAEDCINLYPEFVESGQGKTSIALYLSPGSKQFAIIPEGKVLGQKWVPAQGRYFVFGKSLYEISSIGIVTNRGPLSASPPTPAFAVVNATQMLILSGGQLYVFTFATNVLSAALAAPNGVQQIGYSDGFGVALIQSSNTFRLSAINDFTTWPGTSSTNVSLFPDNIVSMIVDHREIAVLGNTVSTVYTNVGAPIFPFQPVPGAYIEQGSAAAYAVSKLDNSVFWLSSDERGSLVAFRSQGYQGIRVSTFAVETAWQSYTTTSDAISYSFQYLGHLFWHIYFPTADTSWRYDVASGMWHKVGFWDSAHGIYHAHRSQNHSFAFGKHLVGDYASGAIYQMAAPINVGGTWQFCDDCGNPLRWLRRTPYISKERQWMFHNALTIDCEMGLGPMPPLLDGAGNPRDPQLMLRWSDDSTKTWSNIRTLNCGQQGNYLNRAIKRRLGKSRNRVYEASGTDPIPWRFADAYLNATEYKPTMRLADKFRQMA